MRPLSKFAQQALSSSIRPIRPQVLPRQTFPPGHRTFKTLRLNLNPRPSPSSLLLRQTRFFHNSPSHSSYTQSPLPPVLTTRPNPPNPTDLRPAYHLTFTCKPCTHRSTHRVTKQGYHHGTVLITCPCCKSRHVIADHLKVFMDKASSLEEILAKANVNGKPLESLVKKGKLGIRQGQVVGNEGEEDVEFWEDGSETEHAPLEGSAEEVEAKKET